jgi:hypothetical protein
MLVKELGGKMSFHNRRENRVRNHTLKGLALAAGAILVAVALSAPANATSLRQGTVASGATVTGSLPGEVLWSWYETTASLTNCASVSTTAALDPDNGCDNAGNGDNIIRIINPNGSANTAIPSTGTGNTLCAMIYVFDDDEEMGECCGCPVSSAGMITLSVEHNLTANWGINGGFKGAGAVVVVAAPVADGIIDVNDNGTENINGLTGQYQGCAAGYGGATCNYGCDPTDVPGYSTSAGSNLFASITHNQIVSTSAAGTISGLTEANFFDDAGGDTNNLSYLELQCGEQYGNNSGAGACLCPGGSSDF